MKTLKTIQTLSKIGKILSKIIFIFSLIGGIGCAVGILTLALIPEGIKFDGMTIHALIETKAEASMGTMYAAMAVSMVLCAGEAVLSKIAETYFRNELAAGTPFTLAGAKELFRLGICTICIPLGTQLLASVIGAILALALGDVSSLSIDSYSSGSFGMGISFLIMSLFCRHGAELTENGKENQAE